MGEIFQYFPNLLWPREKGQSMFFDALPFQDLQKHAEGGISLTGDFFDFHHFRKRLLPENLVGQDLQDLADLKSPKSM